MWEFLKDVFNFIKDIFLLILLVVLVIFLSNRKPAITYHIIPSKIDVEFAEQTRNIIKKSGIKYNVEEIDKKEQADIIIELVQEDKLVNEFKKEYYPGTNKLIRFSATWQHPKPYVAINMQNWINGVPESGLTLTEYREYVILHEFMHALGYHHQPCNEQTAVNGVCPVLYQSTRGCPKGFKCGHKITEIDYTRRIPNSYF